MNVSLGYDPLLSFRQGAAFWYYDLSPTGFSLGWQLHFGIPIHFTPVHFDSSSEVSL